jgi:predicted nucleic acid-binding protein
MTTYYFDTSALIKYYVAETGSSWVNTISSSPGSLLFTSRLTIIEVRSVLARRRREASITLRNHADALAAFTEDCLTRYRFIEVDPTIVDLAGELLERHSLRAYDAA